jgi:hypothetical protein
VKGYQSTNAAQTTTQHAGVHCQLYSMLCVRQPPQSAHLFCCCPLGEQYVQLLLSCPLVLCSLDSRLTPRPLSLTSLLSEPGRVGVEARPRGGGVSYMMCVGWVAKGVTEGQQYGSTSLLSEPVGKGGCWAGVVVMGGWGVEERGGVHV